VGKIKRRLFKRDGTPAILWLDWLDFNERDSYVSPTPEHRTWAFDEAKNKLSEIVTLALTIGAQHIEHHNGDVVLISKAEYDALIEKNASFLKTL